MADEKCELRVDSALAGRIEDLRQLVKDLETGADNEELGRLDEYGLHFDFVEADTFEDQPNAYWRWQLSWGGPSDEFRFYKDDHRIEYRFHDWFDGAGRWLGGSKKDFMVDLALYHLGLEAYPTWEVRAEWR